MSESTRGISGAHDAAQEAHRLASRLTDVTELEHEDICNRANRRPEEVFGYALAQSVPEELRLEQREERAGKRASAKDCHRTSVVSRA